ncbi:MAG: Na-translocating system protein MpsC family protein [Solirubrobacteraceae bacterium]
MHVAKSVAPVAAATRAGPALAISNHVVRVMNDYTGRGPSQARTLFDTELITVLLRETLTKGERRLVRDGKADVVKSTRDAFDQAMERELVEGVERIAGRAVRAFMSANDLEADMTVQTFVLEPQAGDCPVQTADRAEEAD